MVRGDTRAESSVRKGGGVTSALARGWFLFDRAMERMCNLLLAAAAVLLFLMMAVMTAYVITRKIGDPLPGAFYLSQELMVAVFALPLGAVALARGHIAFELTDSLFPLALQRLFQIVGSAAAILFFGALSSKAMELGLAAAARGEYQQGPVNVPVWPFRILLAVSLVAFALALLVAGVRADRKARGLPPSAAVPKPVT